MTTAEAPGGGLTGKDYETLRGLIPKIATLDTARDFLRRRELSFSASSWEEFFDLRVEPALREAEITYLDLTELLQPEEYGRQNIFLYRCEPRAAAELLARARVQTELERHPTGDLRGLLGRPLVLLRPRKPQIVDVRLEEDGAAPSLVLKVVMTRVYRRQVEERQTGDQVLVIYEQEEERAVNVFRLHADGLLELRIQSRRNTGNYRPDMRLMWELAGEVLPFDRFEAVPLYRAKDRLWSQRSRLAGRLRFTHLELRNHVGDTMTVSTGDRREGDLADDAGAVDAVQAFLKKGGNLDRVNLWWLRSETRTLPSRDLHTILGGEINELAVTTPRSREDHDYVLDRVRAHNE